MRAQSRALLAVAAAGALVLGGATPASAAMSGTVAAEITGSSYQLVDVQDGWTSATVLVVRFSRASEGVVLTLMTCDFANRSRAGSRVLVPRGSHGSYALTLDGSRSGSSREVVREGCATLEISNRATLRTAKIRLSLET